MKIKDTIGNLLGMGTVASRCEDGDVLLAAARELGDSVSFRLIRAREDLAACDIDNEAEFSRRSDELQEAERMFLDIHGKTEVEL